jgi:predicted nuclease of predicted toxin-antitoxin system
VKLLIDENLSPRLVEILSRAYPGSRHVDHLGLRGRPDHEIWDHAARGDFVLVSKDNDFRQLSFLHGAPPKVVWLSVGDAGTRAIADLLLRSVARLQTFQSDEDESLLELPLDPESNT